MAVAVLGGFLSILPVFSLGGGFFCEDVCFIAEISIVRPSARIATLGLWPELMVPEVG